jgi:hypothetical protein
MTEAEVQQALQALAQLGAAAGNSRAGIASVGQSMARLRMEMQRGTGTIQGNSQALQRLMTDFDGLDRATKSSAAGQAMLAEQSKMAGQIMRDAAGQMSGAFVKGGVLEAISFFKNQVFAAAESYTSGVSGTTAALRQQQVGIQSNIDILNRLSNGAQLAAEMLALIPNPASRFGAVIMGGSAALLKTFEEEEKTRKEAYGLLGQELSATTLAYQTQIKAGVAYSKGMTGLREVSNELRLNMAESTNVITKNKDQLVQFGGSVTGGVLRMRRVNTELNGLSEGGRSLREQLYRLGISYEDQSQGIVDYIAMQQQAGTLGSKSSKQLAEESAKYMTNLKAISAFTGEDAKAAQARAQAASEQLAVQSKLRKSQDPAAFEKFQTMIKLMPADMQKGMQQMTAFDGTIVDKNLNILLSQSPTRKKVLDEAFADFQTGMYTSAQLQERQQERMQKYGKALEEEGLAAGDSLGAVTLATGQYGEVTKMLEDQVKSGQKGQSDLAKEVGTTVQQFENLKTKGTDPLLNSVVQLDTRFREALSPEYSKALTTAMTGMVTKGGGEKSAIPSLQQQNEMAMKNTLQALEALKFLDGIPSAFQSIQNIVTKNSEATQTVTTSMTGVSTNFLTASTTLSGAADKFNTAVDRFGRVPSAATGGILEGPKSGFLAQLHGTEAVIPLGDGNSVNVAFKNPAGMLENLSAKTNSESGNTEKMVGDLFNSPNLMTTSLTDLKNIMSADSQATQSLMKQYTDKMDELIAAVNDNEDYLKRIADNIA